MSSIARTLELKGTATTVYTTSTAVDRVRRAICNRRCPTFKKTAVVIAKARNTKALSPSLSRNFEVFDAERPPCQFRNSIHEVRRGKGSAVREAISQSFRTTRMVTLTVIHIEKGI